MFAQILTDSIEEPVQVGSVRLIIATKTVSSDHEN